MRKEVQPATSSDWIRYFHRNTSELRSHPWELHSQLTDGERATIAESLRIFQLGESSEGKHLLRAAKEFASQSEDPLLVRAVSLFIAEEHRHADHLARFLALENIPLTERHWTDSAFRRFRRMWNLEISIAVLLTAELVAKVYYKALSQATNSLLLRSVCYELLRDEVQHVKFHTSILSRIQKRRVPWLCRCWNLFYSCFCSGTFLIVWFGHSRVFNAGGFPFQRYFKTMHLHLKDALRLLETYRQSENAITCLIKHIGVQNATHHELQ